MSSGCGGLHATHWYVQFVLLAVRCDLATSHDVRGAPNAGDCALAVFNRDAFQGNLSERFGFKMGECPCR